MRRGRISEYADNQMPFIRLDQNLVTTARITKRNALSRCDERDQRQDAANMLRNGVYVVSEGANMLVITEGVNQFRRGILTVQEAANAGGVATGLEMAQNSMRISWTRDELDSRLQTIMKAIHRACYQTAENYGTPGNYVNGANIAGFLKVANAMMDQGIV
jgi:glutamate dehydrogenase (NADP+)